MGFNTIGKFQSPRGDFGFLKKEMNIVLSDEYYNVSIPSRGFWFFEANKIDPRRLTPRF